MDDEEIIGYDALWDSAMKCKKGVMWKDSAAHFIHNVVEQVRKLSLELKNGTYQERPHRYFTVTEPKRREVMSIAFRDRVYQRSLNDVAIYPVMTRSFIRDNCACQKGRGPDDARDRLACFLHRYYRKYGKDGWALQIDVKGYYPNMSHAAAKAVFRAKLPENVYRRAAEILDGFPGEVGFNPGSQIIQIVGISLLDKVDHYIKEVLRAKWYQRYMDDMVIIGPDREKLEEMKEAIRAKMRELECEFHPEKTRIYPLSEGIRFLGFIFRLTDSGKVLRLLPGDRVKHERKKLFRQIQCAKRGETDREKCDQCLMSWMAHAKKGTTHNVRRKMEEYYKGLWEEEEHGNHTEADTEPEPLREEADGGHAGEGGDAGGADRRAGGGAGGAGGDHWGR